MKNEVEEVVIPEIVFITSHHDYGENIKGYFITNEGNQNISITVKNTGNEPIYNWALGFDASGEISGLWNGTNYIIKNAGYNNVVEVGESVTFGYILTDLSVVKVFA